MHRLPHGRLRRQAITSWQDSAAPLYLEVFSIEPERLLHMVETGKVGGHFRQPLSHLTHCVVGQGLLNHLQADRAM